MRILYASERPPYPFFLGGAARCAHRLLLEMTSGLNVQCMAAGNAAYTTTPWSYPERPRWPALGVRSVSLDEAGGTVDCGYPVRLFCDFSEQFGKLMESFRPDLVWSQLEGAQAILMAARQKAVQGLLYIHDAESPPAELRAAAGLGVHLVCSSAFLAKKVSKVTGRRAYAVYPASELFSDTTGNPAGFITMVNTHAVKGFDTFLEIARRLPSHRFLVVESWKLTDQAFSALGERLAALPNVSLRRRVSDMREIYKETRLLLVPSVWEEGFGMVAVEAQSCAIPVIASARGGLPEAVGDGGLLVGDYQNVDAWVDAIRQVSRSYDAFANRALKHAASEQFTAASSARSLYEICNSKPTAFSRLDGMLRRFAR